MSTLNHNTAECNSVVRHLLEINIQLTKLMSTIQQNSDVHFNLDLCHLELSEQSNCFMLLPPDIAKYAVDLENDDNSHYVKQGSDKWFQMHKLSRVTGSTLPASIGLDTLAKQKEHYYVHITGRIPPPPTRQLHGKKNEVNGIVSGLNYIDSLDESKSRCGCPTRAKFHIFQVRQPDRSTNRTPPSIQACAVNWKHQYKYIVN